MVKDPVCGMEIDERSTKFSTEYLGKTYFFCSENCKSKFEANPKHYIEKLIQATHIRHTHDHHAHHAHMVEDFKKRFWVSLILTIPILLLSPTIQKFLGLEKLSFAGSLYILFLLSSFIYFYGGFPFLKGLKDELFQKQPGMMTLIGIAITSAYFYSGLVTFGVKGESFFWELATLIDIMLLGHWIEMRSVLSASSALEELVKLLPSEVHLIKEDESIVDIPLEELKPGDKVLIKPGEKIPADGIVLKGGTSVNESMLTGESKPVEKQEGSIVIGGSINGEGSIVVEITKTGKDTYLSQIIELVRQAQESRSRTQDLANRAALFLTLIAISIGSLTFIIWLLLGKNLAFALERAVTVMVITCPHALGLAIPLVVAVSTALSAKNGFLVRNRIAFEKAKDIQAIIFDKTGTLTKGKFGVTDIVKITANEKEILSIAGALESHSEHPIAQGIVQSAKEKGIKFSGIINFKAIPGKGVEGYINGELYRVVSPGFLEENKINVNNGEISKLLSQGKTIVYVLKDNVVLGAIALADIIREESKEAIRKLKSLGIKCSLLTGDNRFVAKWVAEELGLDNYFAEVLPHQKSEKVKETQSRGLTTAMVGDGVNDAPALVQADVGIAIGAGTDVAIESADIILVRNDPRDVVTLIKLAKSTYRKMVQNLLWATGYNIIAIPLAAGVFYSLGILLSPAIGAVFMSLSTVIVAINARLLKI
ncbi:MAG: copper-translocating P-type ATPase [Dictyoglomaceae bacterium]